MKTIEEINEWLEEKYDECHDEILGSTKSGTKCSVEDVMSCASKMQFIDELQEWMKE